MAAQLLEITDMPLREIAQELSFSDEFYLSSCFKKAHGVRPREYRKQIRTNGQILREDDLGEGEVDFSSFWGEGL